MKRQNKPLEIQYLPVGLLTHRMNNARVISKEKFADLKHSLESWNFAEPIVVHKKGDIYTIVAGHQRVLAAQDLGYDTVPCVVLEGMTDKQIAALGIRLNRSSGDDVADELAEVLAGLDTDLQLAAGFDLDDLDALQPAPLDIDDDDIVRPDTPKGKRYTTADLREQAKSYHPQQADTIIEFCDWLDKR